METPKQEKYAPTKKGEIFQLLSNHRRRITIQYCKENGSSELGELAEHIASIEQDKPISEITSSERKRVYTSLQQTHLDRLEEADMIKWDGTEVELTDGARHLEVYLDIVPEGSVSWSMYYLGLSVLSSIVIVGLWTGFIPDTAFIAKVLMSLFVLLLGISAIVHMWYNSEYRLDKLNKTF